MIKEKEIFIIWLFLVMLWNFGVPKAKPIYDVLIAILLFVLSHNLKKYV